MRQLPSLPRVWDSFKSELRGEIDLFRELGSRVALRRGAERPASPAPASPPASPAGLFRHEVLAARRDQWLGEAQLVQPLSVRIVGAVCASLTLALVAFLVCGTYTRRVHASGILAPRTGLLTIASPSAGRISTAGATEGEKVEKGQLLFTIDVDAVSADGPTQKRVIAELQAQKTSVARQRTTRVAVAAIDKQALRDQLDNIGSQRQATTRQAALQAQLTASLKDRADQLKAALGRGIARASDFQNQNYLYIQANAQLAQFEESGLQLDGKIAELKAKSAAFESNLARDLAELDRQIAQLQQQIAESEARRAIEVRAPEDGILTSLRVHAGQQVPAGGTLLTLLPSKGNLQANLYVDSSAIGFVARDEPVMLRYAAFPFQRFGLYRGIVTEVTRAPIDAADDPGRPGGGNGPARNGLYRIIVKPAAGSVLAYGERRGLEAGMQVDADIALEKRRLYSWLLDPVYHLKRSADLVTDGGAP